MSTQRGTHGAKSVSTKSERAPRKAAGSLPKNLQRQLERVELTHPDRILYPEQGLTKLDLAAYYVQVSDLMLPYIVDRPLSLVRCPRGRAAPCFFQRHRSGKTSSALASVMVREGEAVAEYFAVHDLAGLLALVQMGVLEVHLWGARAGDLDRPDRLVFDLDPGLGVPWNQIAETAKKLRVLLADHDLKSFVKTTGGKGLHVVVPVKPQNSWAEIKLFSKSIAQLLVEAEPALYTTNPSKAQRRQKIFLDYLRNDRGATSVAPYSSRALSGAPVSVPLSWRELGPDVRNDQFNLRNLPARVNRMRKDPWDGFPNLRQSLPKLIRET